MSIQYFLLITFTIAFLPIHIFSNFTIGVCSTQFRSTHSNYFLFRKPVLPNNGSSDPIEAYEKTLLQLVLSVGRRT